MSKYEFCETFSFLMCDAYFVAKATLRKIGTQKISQEHSKIRIDIKIST
jgi:hypothetical protein